MTLKKIIFWLHLGAGVSAGVVIFIMSVTGALLAFERQITNWADGCHVTPPSAGASPLPVETLLLKVQSARPQSVPSAFVLQSDPNLPAAFSYGRDVNVFINPYTGEILGEGSKAWRHFFDEVTALHRWLGAGDAHRSLGKGITGACNLAFVFLVVSGFYLWWPRRWNWRVLRPSVWFAGKSRGRERDLNWHKTVGFWCVPVLFLVTSTGVIMSYSWANNLLFKLTRSQAPKQEGRGNFSAGGPAEIQADGLNDFFALAEKKVSGWKSITLRFPRQPGGPLTFSIDQGDGSRPDLRATLVLDADTGDELRWQPFAQQSAGQKARSWVRFIHTGEAGGWLGQAAALIACLGGAMLVLTGLTLTIRRFFFRKKSFESAGRG